MQSAEWAAEQLGYSFNDPALLAQALTHRSAGGPHNERLEFLGDAVLGMVIAEALYAAHPQISEGGLSRLRSSLVRRDTLAALARPLGVSAQLCMGSGEHRTGGHLRSSTLANALESLFGAIYLDGGFAVAREVILRQYAGRLAAVSPADAERKDPKTDLQERLQSRGLSPPDYEVLRITGPSHQRHFEVRCTISALEQSCTGTGSSRRMAEQQAAAAMMRQLADD